MKRRHFIQKTAAAIGAGTLLQHCHPANKQSVAGKIVGANAAAGHLVRDAVPNDFEGSITEVDTLIIGGGISGLSAARWLEKEGHGNFMLVELDKATGGNAVGGQNEYSAYPWGAHYIPIPNNNLPEYLSFLEEHQVITGYDDKGLPFINEYYLCFEPQERLYINGHWQDGLIPDFGVPQDEQDQIRKFMNTMNAYRLLKGGDGRDAFAIPVDASSSDDSLRQLDKITMKRWLDDNGYHSTYLHWYANYCCRDDFGTGYDRVSAWAGIHYFAGRKGIAANAPAQSVITWPEGNSWLAGRLKTNIEKKVHSNALATRVAVSGDIVKVAMTDPLTRRRSVVHARHCVFATPQFVTSRLLADDSRKKIVDEKFHYQPWMVANITTRKLDERNGAGLSWDNVLYNGKALGYVEATHQHLQQIEETKVLTYYYPLTGKTAKEERQLAYQRSFQDWTGLIIDDLEPAHKDIITQILNMDIWVWGHGMISPIPGFIHGPEKQSLQQPIDNKFFFAHTDLSGISNFEEGFYQGIKAAKEVVKANNR